MIVYFSAEGNSRHVALELGRILGKKVRYISECDPSTVEASIILVCPIYSWGLPLPVSDWVGRLNSRYISYFATVFTCGDDIGNAHKLLQKRLHERGVNLDCCMSIQMPNTYVILPGFNVDSSKVEQEKLINSQERIAEVADVLRQCGKRIDVVTGAMPWLKTNFIYPLFLKYGIKTKKFHSNNMCVGCGKCAKACPRHNISMIGDKRQKPKWANDCISCLACYHTCPYHAVQYGRITKNKGQYLFPVED